MRSFVTVHGVASYEFVRGLEPVDTPIFSSDEAVEACHHVDRHTRISVCHRFAHLRLTAAGAAKLGLILMLEVERSGCG
jgi:hypothetical protein